MEAAVAVAKVGKYATSESGDTLEMIERPGGGISFALSDGQQSGKPAKAISNVVARKAISLLAEGVRDGAAARAASDYLFTYRSGKVLARRLQREGYSARQIVQEHSYVAEMWKLLTMPDLLIFLDASFATCNRRKALNWLENEYLEQRRRLRHAKEHCDLYIETDSLTSEEVLQTVLRTLETFPLAPVAAGTTHDTLES